MSQVLVDPHLLQCVQFLLAIFNILVLMLPWFVTAFGGNVADLDCMSLLLGKIAAFGIYCFVF